MHRLNFDVRNDLARSFQSYTETFYDVHRSIQLDQFASIEISAAKHVDLVKLANNKRVMIDQMFKTILRGFRNFYRKLFKVFQ